MATFYILKENGDRLLTEDGADLLVTELGGEPVPSVRRLLALRVGRCWWWILVHLGLGGI